MYKYILYEARIILRTTKSKYKKRWISKYSVMSIDKTGKKNVWYMNLRSIKYIVYRLSG